MFVLMTYMSDDRPDDVEVHGPFDTREEAEDYGVALDAAYRKEYSVEDDEDDDNEHQWSVTQVMAVQPIERRDPPLPPADEPMPQLMPTSSILEAINALPEDEKERVRRTLKDLLKRD